MGKKALLLLSCVFVCWSELSAAEEPRPREDGDQECRMASAVTPAKGEWHKVIPGEVLLATETRDECLWARLKSTARVSEAGAMLPKGTLLWNAGDGRFCVRDTATRFCLHDREKDGRFDKSSTLGGSRGVAVTTGYEDVWIPTGAGEGDHRQELILLEVGADRLRATLRQAGSSNEVSYGLQETAQISLGGLRAEVRRVEGGVEVRVP